MAHPELSRRLREIDEKYQKKTQAEIQTELEKLSKIKRSHESDHPIFCCVIGFVACLVATKIRPLLGLVVGPVVGLVAHAMIKSSNKSTIQQATEAYNRAREEIMSRNTQACKKEQEKEKASLDYSHETQVKKYSNKVMADYPLYETLVVHQLEMFEKVLQTMNTGSHVKYLDVDLIFRVEKDGVRYGKKPSYGTPSDYDTFFYKQCGVRAPTSEAECEGLANALTKLTVKRLKAALAPNPLTFKVSHIDAEVTLQIHTTNPNYAGQ